MRKYGDAYIDLRDIAGYVEIIKHYERGFYFSAAFYNELDKYEKVIFYHYNLSTQTYNTLVELDSEMLQSETNYCMAACFINEHVLIYPIESDGILKLIEANLQTGTIHTRMIGKYSLEFICEQFLLLKNEERLFFYDRNLMTLIEIIDERLVLSNHYKTEVVKHGGVAYLIFERASMDSYELEDIYQARIPKEQIYDKGHLTSINFMPLDDFVREVQSQSQRLSFIVIQATDYDAASAYIGYDQGWIYYTRTSFNSKIFTLFAYSIESAVRQTIAEVSYCSYLNSCNLSAGITPRSIVKHTFLEDGDEIRMYYPKSFTQRGEGREHLLFLGDGVAINDVWDEDDQGENYREFVRIRDIDTWDVIEEINCGMELLRDGSTIVLKNAFRF